MKALDWLGRVLLLVLSGVATLSLIGAIAQVSDMQPAAPPPGAILLPPEQPRAPTNDAMAPGRVAAPAAPADAEAVRWLKALTYAVTALAGFAAAAVITLLRITATLTRIAERRD